MPTNTQHVLQKFHNFAFTGNNFHNDINNPDFKCLEGKTLSEALALCDPTASTRKILYYATTYMILQATNDISNIRDGVVYADICLLELLEKDMPADFPPDDSDALKKYGISNEKLYPSSNIPTFEDVYYYTSDLDFGSVQWEIQLPNDAKVISKTTYDKFVMVTPPDFHHLGFDSNGDLAWVEDYYYFDESSSSFGTATSTSNLPSTAKLISKSEYDQYSNITVTPADQHLGFGDDGKFGWVDDFIYFNSEYFQFGTVKNKQDLTSGMKIITKEQYSEFNGTPPQFKHLGADKDGNPAWVSDYFYYDKTNGTIGNTNQIDYVPSDALTISQAEYEKYSTETPPTAHHLGVDASGKIGWILDTFYYDVVNSMFGTTTDASSVPEGAKVISQADYDKYSSETPPERQHIGFDANGNIGYVDDYFYYDPATQYLGTVTRQEDIPTGAKILSAADYDKFNGEAPDEYHHVGLDGNGAVAWVQDIFYFDINVIALGHASKKEDLPTDAIEITKETYDKYNTEAPRFYELGKATDGQPTWVESSKDQNMLLLTDLKRKWMAVIDRRINDIKACMDDDVASALQKEQLPKLRVWRRAMRDLDVNTVPNVTYPDNPYPTWKYSWDEYGYFDDSDELDY